MSSDQIQFFGSIDHSHGDDRKQLSADYPVYYFREHVEKLREEVEDHEMRLRDDKVPVTEIYKAKAELKKKKEKLATIEASIPKLDGKQKDAMAKHYKALEGMIRDAMPTRSDMMMGLANVHDEVRMMSKPSLDARGMSILGQLGIRAVNGKITRTEAERAYKILGCNLGENTNIERLRRDRSGGVYKNEMYLHEMPGA